MSPHGISIENISKRWGANQVLDSINLTIPKGHFTALLGPSGCGKTTLLRIIAGLETQDSGQIIVNGVDMSSEDTAKRGMSFVFQNYALFPHLTVRDNILFGLQTRGVRKSEQRRQLAEVVALLKIEALLDRKPAALSGGQQQRTALARAVISGRPVCLMDEPLSNLDAKLRQSMRVELRALQRQLGVTMVYVTHDQVEAMTMADQVVLMHGGRVEQCAAPTKLYDAPETIRAAEFIGSPAMNLLPMSRLFKHFEVPIALKQQLGWIGIRPEALSLVTRGGLIGRVVSLEVHGHETLVSLAVGDLPLCLKSPVRLHLEPGTPVAMHIDAKHIHLFDAHGIAIRDDNLASICAEMFQSPHHSDATASVSSTCNFVEGIST